MSYVVLARKYRPMRFGDMVGQDHVGRTLGNAIAQDRVHHAYLFAGARGLGKTTTARIFAKGLVCKDGPTAQPCNACDECVAVNEGRSVDVIEVDGASNNSVENIRNLREQVHYLPQTARRKVYIIDEVHMLTTSAFNALLKTLEEPPPHVNFVFATTEPQKVLPTILSRVSRLDFRRVSPEELVAYLQTILKREEVGIDDGGLRLIARACGGSVRDALTLLDQVIAFADEPASIGEQEVRRVLGQAGGDAIAQLVDAVLSRDPDAVIERFDALVAAGHDLMVLSLQVLEHLRDLTLVKVCRKRDALPELTDAEYEALRAQAQSVDPSTLSQLFDRFTRVVDRLPTSRVQRFLVEMGLLELAQTEPMVPLGDLVERLHALADSGPSGGSSGGGDMARSSHSASKRGTPHRASQRRADDAAAAPPLVQEETPVASDDATDTGADASEPIVDNELTRSLWSMVKGDGVVSPQPSPPAETSTPPSSPSHLSTTGPTPPKQAPTVEPAMPRATAPSPCEPPPPRSDVIDTDGAEPFEVWERLVTRIRAEDEYVSAVLGELGLDALRDGVLRVAAPPRSFAHTELDSRPEIRAQVEQAMRDHLGRAYRLELVEGEPSLPELPSIVLVEQQRREQLQAAVEQEAAEHQGIQRVLSVFGGELSSTKPLD